LFRSLRINIFVFYVVTVIAFLGIVYHLVGIAKIDNLLLLCVVMVCFVVLCAVFISKLAVDPLFEYIKNLQNLSKETLHELNLPISIIRTNVQMIKKTSQNEKSIKRLIRIESACGMLEQRYNELDYMTKRQTKQDIKESFDLAELVRFRVDLLGFVYPNVEFELDLEQTVIKNDKTGLSKVVDNLIDNGVKYSPNSNRLHIKLKEKTLYIQDFGCGMDEVELLRVFDSYYQGNKSMQGFGIGLAMVKRFCDTNNIQLNFKSKKDFGTTVILKFKEK